MALFTEKEEEQVRKAVEAAETQTSGEIRVCIEKKCPENPLDRAANYFTKLGMNKTSLRNGVLIYLASEDRKFAIIGDAGINKVVPTNFWDDTKELMLNHFKEGKLAEGLIAGIARAGHELKTYFPAKDGDINELPDDISYM